MPRPEIFCRAEVFCQPVFIFGTYPKTQTDRQPFSRRPPLPIPESARIARRAIKTENGRVPPEEKPPNDLCEMKSQTDNKSQSQTRSNAGHIAQRQSRGQADGGHPSAGLAGPSAAKENRTGLPDTLKAGLENLSGQRMDDVKVHYGSSRPAQLHAHAYAQGTDIHLAPGQEKHLPHEAWHVVQQKQGRVKPTLQMQAAPEKSSGTTGPVVQRVSKEQESMYWAIQTKALSLRNVEPGPEGRSRALQEIRELQEALASDDSIRGGAIKKDLARWTVRFEAPPKTVVPKPDTGSGRLTPVKKLQTPKIPPPKPKGDVTPKSALRRKPTTVTVSKSVDKQGIKTLPKTTGTRKPTVIPESPEKTVPKEIPDQTLTDEVKTTVKPPDIPDTKSEIPADGPNREMTKGLGVFIHLLHARLDAMGPFDAHEKDEILLGIEAEIAENFILPGDRVTEIANNILGTLPFMEDDRYENFVTQNELLASLDLEPLDTRGDGNCSIHALLGQPDADGTLFCEEAQTHRRALAEGYRDNTLHPAGQQNMALAHENTIRHFATTLIERHRDGNPYTAPGRDKPGVEDTAITGPKELPEGTSTGKETIPDSKPEERKETTGPKKEVSHEELKDNLFNAIDKAGGQHYGTSVIRQVQDNTFDNVIEDMSGAQLLQILKQHGIVNEENGVAAELVTPAHIREALGEHQAATDRVFNLLKPYIKGKVNSEAFVLDAMVDENVRNAYFELLKHQHHWLNAEQLHALALMHGKRVRLFENDFMGGIQQTEQAVDGGEPVSIYSSGGHFERLAPLGEQVQPGIGKTTSEDTDSQSPENDAFQQGMYRKAKTRYHTPFEKAKIRTPTSAAYKARRAHGLGHGLRVSASVLSLVHTIAQKHQIKFPTDPAHLKALSMAALWHDAANTQEDDKIAEHKQGEMFADKLKINATEIPLGETEKIPYRWAMQCLALKGKIGGMKTLKWEDMTPEQQGAAIISGADSYEYVRTYDKMVTRYDRSRNVLFQSGAMDEQSDTRHRDAVIDFIRNTGGNSGGDTKRGLKPEVSTDFEYRGVDAVTDPESPIHEAFNTFADSTVPEHARQVLGILYGFAGDEAPTSSRAVKKRPETTVPKSRSRTSGPEPGEKPTTGTELKTPTIKFFPRDEKGRIIRGEPKASDGSFLQGKPPELAPDKRKAPRVDIAGTLALVHGIPTAYIAGAFQKGYLSSAYKREGLYGRYSRNADKIGGGGLAVYTRAVGKEHHKWPALGQGVGSSGTKSQIILKPDILENGPTWRHSNSDLMGRTPRAPAKLPTGTDTFNAWEFQSETDRNQTFNTMVTGKTAKGVANNEQMFWEQIPLPGNVLAVVCRTQEDRETVIRDAGGNPEDTHILYHGELIPVVVVGDTDTLRTTLGNHPVRKQEPEE